MFARGVSSQVAAVVTDRDGVAVTSGVTCDLVAQGQATATTTNTPTNDGNGIWTVVLTTSETDRASFAVVFRATNAVTQVVNVATWDSDTELTAPIEALASYAALATQQTAILAAIAARPTTSEIAAAVDVALVQAGDGTDLIQAVADAVAQDWVAGDASPVAVLSAIEGSTSYQTLVADATAAKTASESNQLVLFNGVSLDASQSTTLAEIDAQVSQSLNELQSSSHGLAAAKAAVDANNAILAHGTYGNQATKAAVDSVAATVTAIDVEDATVARERTVYVHRRIDGLVDVDPLRLTVGDTSLLCAIDFARDLPHGGRVADVVTLEVVGAPAGLTVATAKRRGSQLKFQATATVAGDYTISVAVRYHGDDGTTAAVVRCSVA